ncbi:hypothetical protein BC834DRAFT_502126 [Gloeopeniophorella convolvens]|nr:hypothetical protein BC834DRAFT_502126 [Gloeopeniophorella convolvens]
MVRGPRLQVLLALGLRALRATQFHGAVAEVPRSSRAKKLDDRRGREDHARAAVEHGSCRARRPEALRYPRRRTGNAPPAACPRSALASSPVWVWLRARAWGYRMQLRSGGSLARSAASIRWYSVAGGLRWRAVVSVTGAGHPGEQGLPSGCGDALRFPGRGAVLDGFIGLKRPSLLRNRGGLFAPDAVCAVSVNRCWCLGTSASASNIPPSAAEAREWCSLEPRSVQCSFVVHLGTIVANHWSLRESPPGAATLEWQQVQWHASPGWWSSGLSTNCP